MIIRRFIGATVLLALFMAPSSLVRGAGLAETRVLETEARQIDFKAWKRAVEDIGKRYPKDYPKTDYLEAIAQYEKDCQGCIDVIARIDDRPPKGKWLSQNATFESSPLTEIHSRNKDKLLTGETFPTQFAFYSLQHADKPWTIIDLGKVQDIGGLQIVNWAHDDFSWRCRKLTAAISTDKKTWTELWQNKGEAPDTWNLTFKTVKARYLKLWLDERNTFHLKSVKIFGPEPQQKDNTDQAAEAAAVAKLKEMLAFRRKSLLANPDIGFDDVLLVRHPEEAQQTIHSTGAFVLPLNYEGYSSFHPFSGNDSIVRLNIRKADAPLQTVYESEPAGLITCMDLDFDGNRLLFSKGGKNNRWQIFEMTLDGKAPEERTLIPDNDVSNYDACYLPNGNIIFTSTAPFVGVPCVQGASHVANTYLFDANTENIRRLTCDQEHNWCPTVLNDGRVLFLRWEYSDLPHFVSRILFSMNPDGTNQREFYGSNSYWPNSMFHARPIPGSMTKFVAIVSGHHGIRRMGELVLFDAARGRHEADGAIQRIPGFGKKIEPIIQDYLVNNSWPKYLHPWPVSETTFLAAACLKPGAPWGLYLVDVFDNIVLLKQDPGHVLLDPIALKKRPRPPVIPSKVVDRSKGATFSIHDIYEGPGLAGVPRGTVKKFRLFTYQFAYHGMGGQVNRVGLDGPWDIKRVLGTVPIEPDGSAMFLVPANTPISIQPLDEDGKAIALMRSWATAMPGEVLSCVGCHESPDTVPKGTALAALKPPATITPWYGPTRGFSFRSEVQPVLNTHCISCHNGKKADRPDLTDRPDVPAKCKHPLYIKGTKFSPSYFALRSYVRSPTMESDMHLLPPYEFHVDTTELNQILEKGHYGVELDTEAKDRLYTWIDLGTPFHGSWTGILGSAKVDHQRARRLDLMKRYGSREDDEENVAADPAPVAIPEPPILPPEKKDPLADVSWGMTKEKAVLEQEVLGETVKSIDLGNGITMKLARIPAGEFVMGSVNGAPDERPLVKTKVEKPFWMGQFEVTNAQFACFDPDHDSRLEHGDFLQFSIAERGYPLNKPEQPVCRVSLEEAEAFCRWSSKKTGTKVRLPSEAQWEWACRAGTEGSHWYGKGTTFSAYANLADKSLRVMDGWSSEAVPEWRPAITSENDKHRVAASAGSYQANPWGLHDMHGNVAEWTRTIYQPAPVAEEKLRLSKKPHDRVIRGGSWYDRPHRASSSARRQYHPWQKIYDVGFRIVIED